MIKLNEEEMKRINKDAVKEMIKNNESRMKVWSLSNRDRAEIQKEIDWLKTLLNS